MFELLTRGTTADNNFSDGVIRADLIVVQNGYDDGNFLDLLEGHFETERLVVVWVERVLFHFSESQSILVSRLRASAMLQSSFKNQTRACRFLLL